MLKKFIRDTKKYFKYSVESAKASLKSEVANSVLNWIWWVLDPICFCIIYTVVFGFVFKVSENYFPAFIFVGISMWDFFNRMMKNSVTIIRNNKSIISKVYLPKYVLLYVKVGVNGFKMLISFVIVAVLMVILQVPISWKLIMVIPILIVFVMFTFGCSCFLLHFGVYVADFTNIVDIVLRMLFYVTGVFYSVAKRIPAPWGSLLTKINPLAFFLDSMRKVILYESLPSFKVLGLWFLISLILCIGGIYLVYKNENSYVKSI